MSSECHVTPPSGILLTDHEVGCTLEVKHEGNRQCVTNVAYVYEGTILGLGRTDGLRTTKRSLTT